MGASARFQPVAAGLATISFLLFACSENPMAPDTVSPAAVSDLEAIQIGPESISLTWTAPGDDGQIGTAAGFDVRYSAKPLADSNWSSATQVSGEPSPKPAGSIETLTITGLTMDESLYVAVKTYDESGNYSALSNVVGIKVVEIFEISFPDPQLEMLIRQKLNNYSQPIYAHQLARIDTLIGGWRGIADLSGLEYCINLEYLFLDYENFSDIRPLANLTKLEKLYLEGNSVVDFAPLANLTNLRMLNLEQTGISDLSALAGLTNLDWLWLKDNAISDLSPLAGLTALHSLYLRNNEISDVSPLVGLVNLDRLWLSDNAISDLSPLASLDNLRGLDISKNPVQDLVPLSGLSGLRELHIADCGVEDLNPLETLTGLETLNLSVNQIGDLNPLAGMTQLVVLWVRDNGIIDISPLEHLSAMSYLDLGQNQIVDIAPLVANQGLQNEDTVILTFNPLSELSINEYIPALQARGVDVEY